MDQKKRSGCLQKGVTASKRKASGIKYLLRNIWETFWWSSRAKLGVASMTFTTSLMWLKTKEKKVGNIFEDKREKFLGRK